jgi:hypothetical protein
MALEIKVTPVLEGQDAERFLKLISTPKKSISKSKRAIIRKRTLEILKNANI